MAMAQTQVANVAVTIESVILLRACDACQDQTQGHETYLFCRKPARLTVSVVRGFFGYLKDGFSQAEASDGSRDTVVRAFQPVLRLAVIDVWQAEAYRRARFGNGMPSTTLSGLSVA
jgi:hypothetical protein